MSRMSVSSANKKTWNLQVRILEGPNVLQLLTASWSAKIQNTEITKSHKLEMWWLPMSLCICFTTHWVSANILLLWLLQPQFVSFQDHEKQKNIMKMIIKHRVELFSSPLFHVFFHVFPKKSWLDFPHLPPILSIHLQWRCAPRCPRPGSWLAPPRRSSWAPGARLFGTACAAMGRSGDV